MQNPYVKYLKTKNGYFYLFIMNTAIFSVAAFPMTLDSAAENRGESLSCFSVCQYEAITYLLYSGGEGQLYLASSADLPTGSIAPCETAPPPPTAQGFSFCQARRPSILFTTCQQKQPAWIPCLQRLSQWAMGKALSD